MTMGPTLFLLVAPATLAAVASAHFVLEVPTSVGYEDMREGTAPCGGFEPTRRDAVTDWPVAGAPLKLISTHPRSRFTVRIALLPNTTAGPLTFSAMLPVIQQSGLGWLCLPSLPGIAAWEGQDAVLQVTQVATDGELFQCAAIRFTAGAAAPAPPLCTNSSGVSATFLAGGDKPALAPDLAPAPAPSVPDHGSPPTGAAGRKPHPAMSTVASLALVTLLLPWLVSATCMAP